MPLAKHSLDLEAGRIRGFIAYSFAEFVQERFGLEEMARRLRHRLPEQAFDTLDADAPGLGLLPSAWYRAAPMHQLLNATLADIPSREHHDLAEAAGRYVFRQQINGLQRALMALLLSPTRYTKHSPKAWRHNFASGDIVYDVTENSHGSSYHRWNEHHPLICRAMMVGRLEVYAAMGLSDARVHIECCKPLEGCRSRVHWGPRDENEPETPTARL